MVEVPWSVFLGIYFLEDECRPWVGQKCGCTVFIWLYRCVKDWGRGKSRVLPFCFCQHFCLGISKQLNVFRLAPLQPEVLLEVHCPREGQVNFSSKTTSISEALPQLSTLKGDKVKFRSWIPKTEALSESKPNMLGLQVLIILKKLHRLEFHTANLMK